MKMPAFLPLLFSILFLGLGCDGCSDVGANGEGDPCNADSECASDSCQNGQCAASALTDGGGNVGGTDAGGGNGSSDGGGGNGNGNAGDGGGNMADAGPLTRVGYCEGEGPPILTSDQGGVSSNVCTGDIAQTTFRWAMCSCESPTGTDELFTDSFDSSQGGYVAGTLGGSVGTNGDMTMTSLTNIGGSLWVSGDATWTNELNVGAELRVGGSFSGTNPVDVGLDAYLVGDATVTSDLTVGGDVYQPTGSTLNVSGNNNSNRITGPVAVNEPCACGADDLVNIDEFIQSYAVNNDNAEVGLDPDVLSGVGSATQLDLSCGRFYLSEVTGTADITITVQDRTALFVGGDLQTTGTLTIELTDGAEVDLFVGGSVTSTNQLNLGSQAAPAKVRFYVGGEGTITFTGDTLIAGNFYAPKAELSFTDNMDVFGSVFARRITFTNTFNIHYDRAVLRAGDGCVTPPEQITPDAGPLAPTDGGGTGIPDAGMSVIDAGPPPAAMCTDCTDCGNQACVDGTCGACTTNSDCCAPLICFNGTCDGFSG
jgi:hypothetical protein